MTRRTGSRRGNATLLDTQATKTAMVAAMSALIDDKLRLIFDAR